MRVRCAPTSKNQMGNYTMAKKKTLEQLQEEHSEMLATATDLGMKIPEEFTVDFATAEAGAAVCSNLDALIRQFRSGIDEQDAKKGVAADVAESDNVTSVKSPKSKKTSAKKSTKAAPAEAAETSGEATVAKTAKKATAKKATKKPAAKKAVKKAASKGNGAARGSRFPDEAKITWGAGKKNPAREGGGRAERIEKVIKSSGKTVKAFIAGGGNPQTLRNCVKAKLCTVA
jgi:hypothetical protein